MLFKRCFFIITLNATALFSQSFSPLNLNLIGAASGDAEWLDYDNDGDLDILITGRNDNMSGHFTRFYENQDNLTFVAHDTIFPWLSYSSIASGDVDNDGDLDILLSGRTAEHQEKSVLYRNDLGGVFSMIDIPLQGVLEGDVLIAELNNDELPEIVITGTSLNNYYTKIYKNLGDFEFEEVTTNLPAVWRSSLRVGDIDNDSDNDVLICGSESYKTRVYITKIFRNNGDFNFEELASLQNIDYGMADWTDLDNDSDLDIVLTGESPGNIPTTKIYRNDNGQFIEVTTAIPDLLFSSIDFGDYDIDGDMDFILTGDRYWAGLPTAVICTNKGSFDFVINDSVLAGVEYGRGLWGDYNNDSYLDALIFGQTNDGYILEIYENKSSLVADFVASKTSGNIPFTTMFRDSSLSSTNAWQWDFENDGIIDSYSQHPTHTYFEADSFSVKLIVSNNVYSDTLIKENYIVTYIDTIPNLYSIKDIPNDQGGWVKVNFVRSAYDDDSLIMAKTLSSELYTVEIDDGSGWTAATSTVAYGKTIYYVLVPTTKDSSSESSGLINFRVIAGLDEGNFVSDTLSGYSVDNLKPSIPSGLMATIQDSMIELSWESNLETDLQYYSLYRSNDGSPFDRIAQTTDTVYADSQIELNKRYSYALTAIDHSGNESDFSNIVSVLVTHVNGKSSTVSTEYYLAQNYHNPFNSQTTIKYGVEAAGHVKIVIYDLLGRIVKEIVNEYQNSGHYEVIWNSKNKYNQEVSSGIYYYRIQTVGFDKIKKMLLIK